MKNLACLVIAALGAAACITVAPPQQVVAKPGSEKVRIFYKSDPPATCREIAPIEVSDGEGCGDATGATGMHVQQGSYAGAYQLLRNAAVDAGANAVLVRGEDPAGGDCGHGMKQLQYRIRGAAYSCPPDVMAAPEVK